MITGYGGGGLGLLALGGWGWMLVQQRAIHRQAVAQLRDQIAGDLHDDLGSNLGGIVLLSEIGSKLSADIQSRADFQAIKVSPIRFRARRLPAVSQGSWKQPTNLTTSYPLNRKQSFSS